MQNETSLKEYSTVHNAIITLGDTDDSGKGRHFKSRFIQPGLVNIEKWGVVLIRKETLDKSLKSMIGTPVIILHKDVTDDNADDLRVGINSEAYYNISDGWYYAEGVMWNKTAQNLVTDQDWSVSCSYDILEVDNTGGIENNIKYDVEFTKLNFRHLALVNNPRYERANIVFNSKTEILNGGNGSGNFGHAGRPGQVGGSSNGGTVDLTNYFTSTPTIQDVKDFLNEMVKQGKEFATLSPDWFIDIPSSSKKKKHIAYSSQQQYMNKAQKNRHNKYVMALEDLLGNAQYLNPSPNTKPIEKPNTQQYHYFKSEAKIGDKTYKIMFDTEEYKGDSTIKPQTVHLYDVREVKNNSSLSANVLRSVKNLKEECTNIINAIQENFNPNVKEHEEIEVNNNKETEMVLLDELKKLITKVENDKGEKDMEIDNEKVDKRDIIRQIMAIAGKEEASEDVRTIAKLAEKLAYDKSEAGTADNEKDDDKKECDNKKEVKNEDEKDEKKVKETKEEVKEDVENKCKNSVDNSKPDYFAKLNEIYNAATSKIEQKSEYVSRAEREKAAEDYFKG